MPQYLGPHLVHPVDFRTVVESIIPAAEKYGASIIALAGNQKATASLASCFKKKKFSDGQPVKVHQVYSPETARDVVTQLTQ